MMTDILREMTVADVTGTATAEESAMLRRAENLDVWGCFLESYIEGLDLEVTSRRNRAFELRDLEGPHSPQTHEAFRTSIAFEKKALEAKTQARLRLKECRRLKHQRQFREAEVHRNRCQEEHVKLLESRNGLYNRLLYKDVRRFLMEDEYFDKGALEGRDELLEKVHKVLNVAPEKEVA
jgi:hypothetical protein